MRISVLGTGMVGRAVAGRLAELGHDVAVGTRDPRATLDRREADALGTPPYRHWQSEHPDVALLPLAEAGAHGELLVNATNGVGSLEALAAAAIDGRDGLVVVDVANPLEFREGSTLPSLTVANTDSLAERIQRAFPTARVVKTLNTMNAAVMVDPHRVPGEHAVFVAGDDADAKRTVTALLGEIGWAPHAVVDLGGLVAARGTEMFLPLWVAMMQALGTADFNIAVTAAPVPTPE